MRVNRYFSGKCIIRQDKESVWYEKASFIRINYRFHHRDFYLFFPCAGGRKSGFHRDSLPRSGVCWRMKTLLWESGVRFSKRATGSNRRIFWTAGRGRSLLLYVTVRQGGRLSCLTWRGGWWGNNDTEWWEKRLQGWEWWGRGDVWSGKLEIGKSPFSYKVMVFILLNNHSTYTSHSSAAFTNKPFPYIVIDL